MHTHTHTRTHTWLVAALPLTPSPLSPSSPVTGGLHQMVPDDIKESAVDYTKVWFTHCTCESCDVHTVSCDLQECLKESDSEDEVEEAT